MIYVEALEHRRLLSAAPARPHVLRAGSIDPIFANNGVSAGARQSASIQSNGRSLIIFDPSSYSSIGLIEGLNPDGTPDTAFDQTVAKTFPANFSPEAINVEPDDRIVVSGTIGLPGQNPPCACVGLNADGSLNTSFGIDGIATVPLSTNSADGVSAASDGGKIILLSSDFAGSPSFRIACLNANGSLTASFGNGGVLTFTVPMAVQISSPLYAIQPDGRVLVLTDAHYLVPHRVNDAMRAVLFRFNLDGSLDSNFGVAGQVTLASQAAWVRDMELQTNGDIDLYFGNGQSGFVEQLESDGAVNLKFGSAGRANVALLSTGHYDRGEMLVDAEDRIIVAGVQEIGEADVGGVGDPGHRGSDFTGLVRLTAAGRRDPAFGRNGVAILFHQFVYFSSSTTAWFSGANQDIVVPGLSGDIGVLDMPLVR